MTEQTLNPCECLHRLERCICRWGCGSTALAGHAESDRGSGSAESGQGYEVSIRRAALPKARCAKWTCNHAQAGASATDLAGMLRTCRSRMHRTPRAAGLARRSNISTARRTAHAKLDAGGATGRAAAPTPRALHILLRSRGGRSICSTGGACPLACSPAPCAELPRRTLVARQTPRCVDGSLERSGRALPAFFCMCVTT
eukprot:227104-Rhodomonas_salina.1